MIINPIAMAIRAFFPWLNFAGSPPDVIMMMAAQTTPNMASGGTMLDMTKLITLPMVVKRSLKVQAAWPSFPHWTRPVPEDDPPLDVVDVVVLPLGP